MLEPTRTCHKEYYLDFEDILCSTKRKTWLHSLQLLIITFFWNVRMEKYFLTYGKIPINSFNVQIDVVVVQAYTSCA